MLDVGGDEGVAAPGRRVGEHGAAGAAPHRHPADGLAPVGIAHRGRAQLLLHKGGVLPRRHAGPVRRAHPADAIGAALMVQAVLMELLQIAQLQPPGQAAVDPLHHCVQIGVGADGGHVPLRQGQQHPACGALVGEGLHRVEDNRVVGHDQLAALLRRLLNHGQGDVQGHQQALDLGLPPAHQKTGVVKIHLKVKGGQLVQKAIDLVYRCHASHSFFISLSSVCSCFSSSRRAAASGFWARARPVKARSVLSSHRSSQAPRRG